MVHLPGRKENCEKSQNINLNYDKLLTLTKMPATENLPDTESSFLLAGTRVPSTKEELFFRRRDAASKTFSKLFLTAVN